MVSLENRDKIHSVSSSGNSSGLPPRTMEGTPDFGNQDDWEQWEGELYISELDLAASVLSHPASSGASEVEITQALLHDGWRERHAKMKADLKDMSFLRSAGVLYLDDFRLISPFDEIPPGAA